LQSEPGPSCHLRLVDGWRRAAFRGDEGRLSGVNTRHTIQAIMNDNNNFLVDLTQSKLDQLPTVSSRDLTSSFLRGFSSRTADVSHLLRHLRAPAFSFAIASSAQTIWSNPQWMCAMLFGDGQTSLPKTLKDIRAFYTPL
jgi:hypothetical protein